MHCGQPAALPMPAAAGAAAQALPRELPRPSALPLVSATASAQASGAASAPAYGPASTRPYPSIIDSTENAAAGVRLPAHQQEVDDNDSQIVDLTGKQSKMKTAFQCYMQDMRESAKKVVPLNHKRQIDIKACNAKMREWFDALSPRDRATWEAKAARERGSSAPDPKKARTTTHEAPYSPLVHPLAGRASAYIQPRTTGPAAGRGPAGLGHEGRGPAGLGHEGRGPAAPAVVHRTAAVRVDKGKAAARTPEQSVLGRAISGLLEIGADMIGAGGSTTPQHVPDPSVDKKTLDKAVQSFMDTFIAFHWMSLRVGGWDSQMLREANFAESIVDNLYAHIQEDGQSMEFMHEGVLTQISLSESERQFLLDEREVLLDTATAKVLDILDASEEVSATEVSAFRNRIMRGGWHSRAFN
jgi:hypothetical protein